MSLNVFHQPLKVTMANRPCFFKIISKFVKVGFTMIKYQGMEFQTSNNVYEPAEDTFLLGDNLMVRKSDSVLEIGTGTGIIAILASKKAQSVTAIDINKYAVECASNNAAKQCC